MASPDLHHLGDVPDADLSPLGGRRQELRTAAKTVAGDLVGAVGAAGELGGAGGQRHRQRHVLRVLALHERTVGGMSLVFGPEGRRTDGRRETQLQNRRRLLSYIRENQLTHQGSSVGSQQTRQTLQVKHMARSSPVDAGCGQSNRRNMKEMQSQLSLYSHRNNQPNQAGANSCGSSQI